jgi:ketosteroid isomerase-like protein
MTDLDAVRKYFAGWNAQDADAILASLTEDGTYEDPGTGGPISGPALKA